VLDVVPQQKISDRERVAATSSPTCAITFNEGADIDKTKDGYDELV
jgi:hypothetical protein